MSNRPAIADEVNRAGGKEDERDVNFEYVMLSINARIASCSSYFSHSSEDYCRKPSFTV